MIARLKGGKTMMPRQILSILCSVLILYQQGCALIALHQPISSNLPEQSGARLSWGMSTEQVRSVLGDPDGTSRPTSDQLWWHYSQYCLFYYVYSQSCEHKTSTALMKYIFMGVFTLGILFFFPPHHEYYILVFKDGRFDSWLNP